MGKQYKVWIFQESVSEQILKSPEMQAIIHEKCEEIASRAGEGFEAEVKVGKRRCAGRVKAVTWEAAGRNAKENTLVRAMK